VSPPDCRYITRAVRATGLGYLLCAAQAVGQAPTAAPTVEVVARGLMVPSSLALAPDGRLFISERTGNIRVLAGGKLVEAPWATVRAFDGSARNVETGLMALTLDPQFPRSPYVYVCYTEMKGPASLINRVSRLRERDGRGEAEQVLIDSIPGGPYHNGCRLKFGPDGKLYVSTGDAYVERTAQDSSSLAGKILRVNPDGSIPADNPVRGSRMWSMGHRNAQAMAWDSAASRLVVVEHGSGQVDEVNVVRRGGNYGWPVARGRSENTAYINPILVFHAAPAGASFLSGRAGVRGLVVATLSGRRLMRFTVEGDTATIVENALLSGYGRLRDVIEAPDGSLLVATSNRDGRGTPAADDDRILRVRLRPVP
jgi:glucose/arabinose dehydrogenase